MGEWVKDAKDAMNLLPAEYPPDDLVEETTRRGVGCTVWFRKLPDLGERIMGTLCGLLPWGHCGILAMSLPRIQQGEILTRTGFVRFATPKLADLACMRLHGLAIVYENYVSPYDLDCDEEECGEPRNSKEPNTA